MMQQTRFCDTPCKPANPQTPQKAISRPRPAFMDAPPKKHIAIVRSWGTGIEKKPRKLPVKTVETQIRALCDGTVENYLHLLAVHETRGAGITELDKARKLLRQQWQNDYENNRPLSFGPGKLIPMCARCA